MYTVIERVETDLVAYTPDCDADALADVEAGLGDGIVVGLLLSKFGGSVGLENADIELSDGYIEAGVGEDLELSLYTADLAEDKVGL
jgi:hypothetical protein